MTTQRHPSVADVAEWFDASHLRPGLPRNVSERVSMLADDVLDTLPDSAELTNGLRRLLEAKDSFVRCAIKASRANL